MRAYIYILLQEDEDIFLKILSIDIIEIYFYQQDVKILCYCYINCIFYKKFNI